MKRYLRDGEICPVHHQTDCTPCHRKARKRLSRKSYLGRGGKKNNQSIKHIFPSRFLPAVQQIEDPTLERGYREVISESERRRRKRELIERNIYNGTLFCGYHEGAAAEDGILSGYCGKKLESYDEIDLCHRIPKGHGGGTHDDHFDNLFLGCRGCNCRNGSRRAA